LRLRRGRLGGVAGLPWLQRSGTCHRNAVLVLGARWGHGRELLHLVRGIRRLVRVRVHIGRQRLSLVRGVRRLMHVLGCGCGRGPRDRAGCGSKTVVGLLRLGSGRACGGKRGTDRSEISSRTKRADDGSLFGRHGRVGGCEQCAVEEGRPTEDMGVGWMGMEAAPPRVGGRLEIGD
jgi:hypothetical protein